MGCTSSTQTTAQDTTRPNTKQDGSTSGTSNENGGPAADSAAPVPSEEIQSSSAAAAHNEPEAAVVEAITSEPAESNPSMTAESTEEPAPAPAPSESTTGDQADSSPPGEAPASGGDS